MEENRREGREEQAQRAIAAYKEQFADRLEGWQDSRGQVHVQLWPRIYYGNPPRGDGGRKYYQTLPGTSCTFVAPDIDTALRVVLGLQGMLDELMEPIRREGRGRLLEVRPIQMG